MKEKNKIKRRLIRFFILLFISLFVTLGFHLSFKNFIGKVLLSNRIIESYVVNFILGYASYIFLLFSLKKYVSSLGFIFMYISFFKFLVFYLLFKPFYNLNLNIELSEFLTIMIPYGVTLIAEIYYISRVLKN